MKHLVCLILSIFLCLQSNSQTKTENSKEEYFKKEQSIACYSINYQPFTSLERTEIGVFDARHKANGNFCELISRYTDNVLNAHPSVLAGSNRITHYVAIVSNAEELSNLVKIVSKINIRNIKTEFILVLTDGWKSEFDQMDWPTFFKTIFILPSDETIYADLCVQAMFNGIDLIVKEMPMQLKRNKYLGVAQPKTRLAFSPPFAADMDPYVLNRIKGIADEMISHKAAPGAYILVARHGRIIFSKGFGHLDYESGEPVTASTIYDLASVTKGVATTLLTMKAFDDKKLDCSTELGSCIDVPADKRQLRIDELLLHQSGLSSGIPTMLCFVDSTRLHGNRIYNYKKKIGYTKKIDNSLYVFDSIYFKPAFSNIPSDVFKIRISSQLYMKQQYCDSIYERIRNEVVGKKKYRYSDLNFILLQKVIEARYNKTIDKLFAENFANPLGAKKLCFNPWKTLKISQIAPTENDTYFRHDLIRGFVHDPTTAALGGFAGSAGLFGTANNVAKICQILLNNGSYGGIQFIDSATISMFTSRKNNDNRRGLGFDKPETKNGAPSPVTCMASESSYGHSGFSGTLFWIDPEYDMIYIFLSNRIHPNVYNRDLTKMNIRGRIHELIYESINKNKMAQ